MNVHYRCPNCDERGELIYGQDDDVVACTTDGCRVYVFEVYYG